MFFQIRANTLLAIGRCAGLDTIRRRVKRHTVYHLVRTRQNDWAYSAAWGHPFFATLLNWRHQRMSTNYAFKPETVKALATAFSKSWSFISSDPRFATENQTQLQRKLSVCLMQLAAAGEKNPLRLANGAINRIRIQLETPGAADFNITAALSFHWFLSRKARTKAMVALGLSSMTQ
jgi:hypothetical protein